MKDNDIAPLSRAGRVEKYHFNEGLAKRLVVEKELKGHRLCVNRLAWNWEGTRLLSGSDDKRVLMYAYPNYDQLPLSIVTEHQSNIFGVQFLPYSGDQILISGAMDTLVQLHRLDALPERQFRYASGTEEQGSPHAAQSCVEVQPGTIVFSCHRGRVKDVEVDEESPNLFWSVSEDGTIRQYDVRCNQMQSNAGNVLIGVRSQNGADTIDLKGMDINKARSHLMGVACGDPYIRIFDRRKLTLGTAENTFPEPLLKLSPPHLPIIRYVDAERCHSTYVNFSHRGDKLVGLFHADHAYAFDIASEGSVACTYFRSTVDRKAALRNGVLRNGHSSHEASSSSAPNPYDMSEEAVEMKDEAMCHLAGRAFTKANKFLDRAIRCSPGVPQLYVHRARSFLKRRLPGDNAFALRDCDQAIAINPAYAEPYLVRCEAVEAIGQLQTALRLLRCYVRKFPEKKRSDQVVELRAKIIEQLSKRKRHSPTKRSREADDEDQDGDDFLMEDAETWRAGQASSSAQAGFSHPAAPDSQEDDPVHDEDLFPLYSRPVLFFYDSPVLSYSSEQQPGESCSPGGVWWQTQGGQRLLMRYVGHLNVQTDIKECIFLGQNDALVACGSDDGNVFIYNTETGDPVNVLAADQDVCNCVQCHPTESVLATSGIESVVRLWSPSGDPVMELAVEDCIGSNIEMLRRGPRQHFNVQDQIITRVRMILDNYELREVNRGARRSPDCDEEDEGDRRIGCRMV